MYIGFMYPVKLNMRKKNYKAKTSMKCDGLQKYRCKLAKKWEINLMATTKKIKIRWLNLLKVGVKYVTQKLVCINIKE